MQLLIHLAKCVIMQVNQLNNKYIGWRYFFYYSKKTLFCSNPTFSEW
jgi:hypothetical protein